ncbi:MAG: hypothetical protein IMF19_04540 [Proteobacteria bacterium]|nr:hypothetical protein [Pseudomonadota bacterium]
MCTLRYCTLIRMDYKTNRGTFGVFLVEGRMLCLTLERSFLYNRRNESCIPLGKYHCTYYIGKSKEGYLLHNVTSRSGIMIHVGNTLADTSGCILLGKSLNVNGELEHSTEAVNLLERMFIRKDFYLSIEEYK